MCILVLKIQQNWLTVIFIYGLDATLSQKVVPLTGCFSGLQEKEMAVDLL